MERQYMDCYAVLENGRLTIGNAAIERSWDLTGPLPMVQSLVNKCTGKEWLTTDRCAEWIEWPERPAAFFRQGLTVGGMTVKGMQAVPDNDCGVGMTHLHVSVYLEFAACKVEWMHLVYPGLPILRSFLRVTATGEPRTEERPFNWPDDVNDCFPLSIRHGRWKCVSFTDKTDDYDNLVNTTQGMLTRRESGSLQGNLLFAEDHLAHEGITLVKEGPTPQGRLPGVGDDFVINGMNLFASGWGFDAAQLQTNTSQDTYGTAVMLWRGTQDDALRTLHRYHRAVRMFVPDRDAQIMANTWGDGNADGRLCEEFLMNELHRAKELGISYYQIDDGWQQGVTCNSVNAVVDESGTWGEGYYKADPEFWSVNKTRFPHGLEPIVEYAKENNIRLGLWFSPDSINDFENWQRDSDMLLQLHRRYGVTAFKMDGLIFRSKLGEENFGRMMRRVVRESAGKVFFNLDTTAGVRNGYLGRVQYGSLFLENRFSNPFGYCPNYWPYRTLRNLWNLSRYLPTERLQVEFLNVKNNVERYCGDPLSPSACGQEYAFALTTFASPLAWMELSVLDEEAVNTLHADIAAYRAVQADILAGHVLPIGREPDGTQWTGFQSVTDDESGYLLILREYNDDNIGEYTLWGQDEGVLTLEPVIGSGKQTEIEMREGKAVFVLDKPHSFALYRYRR